MKGIVKYHNITLNSVEEVCEMFRYKLNVYDDIYDFFRRNKFDSIDVILEKLHSYFTIEIESEDVFELLNLPFKKIYFCPECGGNLIVCAEKSIMKCDSCDTIFDLNDNYICPICNYPILFDKKTEKLCCTSCKESFSPHRFAKPKNNWLVNEVGEGWEKVTPNGYHHNASPLPKVDIYPNPYR